MSNFNEIPEDELALFESEELNFVEEKQRSETVRAQIQEKDWKQRLELRNKVSICLFGILAVTHAFIFDFITKAFASDSLCEYERLITVFFVSLLAYSYGMCRIIVIWLFTDINYK